MHCTYVCTLHNNIILCILSTESFIYAVCKLYPVNRPKCVFYRDLTGTRLNSGWGKT